MRMTRLLHLQEGNTLLWGSRWAPTRPIKIFNSRKPKPQSNQEPESKRIIDSPIRHNNYNPVPTTQFYKAAKTTDSLLTLGHIWVHSTKSKSAVRDILVNSITGTAQCMDPSLISPHGIPFTTMLLRYCSCLNNEQIIWELQHYLGEKLRHFNLFNNINKTQNDLRYCSCLKCILISGQRNVW